MPRLIVEISHDQEDKVRRELKARFRIKKAGRPQQDLLSIAAPKPIAERVLFHADVLQIPGVLRVIPDRAPESIPMLG